MSEQSVLESNAKSLIFDTPLYSEVVVDQHGLVILGESFWGKFNVRYSCPFCNDISIFHIDSFRSKTVEASFVGVKYYSDLCLRCSSNSNHVLRFIFNILSISSGFKIIKIGQYPSLADLHLPQVQKYKSLLKRYYQEFTKAIGLNAHGVGIGSFVYLRRIIEYLLEEAHCSAKGQENWDEDKYVSSRVIEKIALLRGILPEVLVENKECYAILSKGIHELGEDECLGYFAVLRDMVELILDEELARKIKENREKLLKDNIQSVAQRINSK